jgi:hypothetical protein
MQVRQLSGKRQEKGRKRQEKVRQSSGSSNSLVIYSLLIFPLCDLRGLCEKYLFFDLRSSVIRWASTQYEFFPSATFADSARNNYSLIIGHLSSVIRWASTQYEFFPSATFADSARNIYSLIFGHQSSVIGQLSGNCKFLI